MLSPDASDFHLNGGPGGFEPETRAHSEAPGRHLVSWQMPTTLSHAIISSEHADTVPNGSDVSFRSPETSRIRTEFDESDF